MLITGIGQDLGTIIWLDWKGDEAAWVNEQIERACVALKLRPPAWGDERRDSEPRMASDLVRAADAALRRVGQRLLLIDLDSDSYQVVPVSAADFSALHGTSGDGYELKSVEDAEGTIG
ncbi:hypothetical protein [uncultured Agrococcus sp.]|uniref:DUF6630 family protein n=1 Tax=uncultured Agrococcus sp. TaxID=382258 RepID=UPI0025CC53A1|nr:hypothetical protein [uncultured Agrococcus sp.]